MDCLFCKIASGSITANKLYEDDEVIAFYDINPQAPIHFLVIPKKHIENIDDLNEETDYLIMKIFAVIRKLAKNLSIENNYRIVSNCGAFAGQTVLHLHFHVLSGRELTWPPG